MNLLFNTLVAYKLVISFKEERWAGRPVETKDRELSHRTVTISISLLNWFVNDAMNENIIGKKCLKKIFVCSKTLPVFDSGNWIQAIGRRRLQVYIKQMSQESSCEVRSAFLCMLCIKKFHRILLYSSKAFGRIFISWIDDFSVTSIIVLTLPWLKGWIFSMV